MKQNKKRILELNCVQYVLTFRGDHELHIIDASSIKRLWNDGKMFVSISIFFYNNFQSRPTDVKNNKINKWKENKKKPLSDDIYLFRHINDRKKVATKQKFIFLSKQETVENELLMKIGCIDILNSSIFYDFVR